MRVSRLAAGPHRIDLVPPSAFAAQSLAVTLDADKVTPFDIVLSRAGVSAKAPQPAAARASATEVAPAPAEADAPEAEPAPRARTTGRPKHAKAARAERTTVAEKKRPAAPSRSEKPEVAAATGKNHGVLLINAKPACEIIIDGQRTGLSTPQRSLKVKPGKHTVTLVNKQYGIKAARTVAVDAGGSIKVIVDLTDKM
jgi:hypothetical protein